MAISRDDKEALVTDIVEKLKKSQAVYVTNYQGMTMMQFNSLRGKLRESNGGYQVVKNSLAVRALRQADLAVPGEMFEGPVALGFAFADVAATAKTLLEFAKESEKFQIKGAVLGQQVLSLKEVESLAALPPLPVIRAQLLGLIATPASRIAGTLAGGVRQVVRVVHAFSEKEQGTAPAGA